MQCTRFAVLGAVCAALLCAHPMGYFSVNHYARILPHDGGADLLYILDLAEIPTFELLQKWNLQPDSPRPAMEARAAAEAREWLRNLRITTGGESTHPQFVSSKITMADGVGGMKVLRVEVKAAIKSAPGKIDYDDRNYAERAGWKEIVVGNGPDKSQALTAYPADPTVPQPQDLRASVDITGKTPTVISHSDHAPEQPKPAPEPTPATAPAPAQSETMGSLKRGDYLSTTLHGGPISFGVGLICLLVAFGLGALHAFEPGHGKTMVAAYLVGSRGTPKHAVLLGLMTTFTHTVSVFLLGFVTIFLSRYIMPEKMTTILGVLSGVSIVWIGGLMLYKRWTALLHAQSHHHHHHHHDHPHDHAHAHPHDHAHDHHHHDHHHDHGHAHHHMPEGDITMGSLIALGASGGMVPCPAALILLLTCISLGRPAFGVLLLLAFSVGLAVVLMATGLVVLYAKHLIPERHRNSNSGFMQALPVISAAVVVVVGLLMTGASLGLVPAVRFLG
jgi:ABC-type nickel/cobalt efflux system permease component RcnA